MCGTAVTTAVGMGLLADTGTDAVGIVARTPPEVGPVGTRAEVLLPPVVKDIVTVTTGGRVPVVAVVVVATEVVRLSVSVVPGWSRSCHSTLAKHWR
mmetsp:Transcript_77774/g.180440  ORF Transcript_77774/g.180440 Transcript_77774/m.180440 type:complete len:97 (+) Transcript_77774:129-419(+)